MRTTPKILLGLLALGGAAAVAVVPAAGAQTAPPAADNAQEAFAPTFQLNADATAVTLPLHRGVSGGQAVYYVLLDSSSDADARRRGINHSERLNNARGTAAVERVTGDGDALAFPATVDFAPERVVTAGPTGFPPAAAQPGSVGDAGYSPLAELPDGTVLNAPQVANDSGRHDKVVDLDVAGGHVTLALSEGRFAGRDVRYLSTEASDPTAAALEAATLAPALAESPGSEQRQSRFSARSGLIAFVNGQTGVGNPERQGLNSAILDGRSPLNVIQTIPNRGFYSPLWDVHAAAWSAAAVASGANTRQSDFDQVFRLADRGLVTSPDGSRLAPAGFVVNCPPISVAPRAPRAN